MRWVFGRSNVQDCPCKVGRWSLRCPRGQNVRQITKIMYLVEPVVEFRNQLILLVRRKSKFKLKEFSMAS